MSWPILAMVCALCQALADVLTRLPQMTNEDDLSCLLPCNWQPPTAAASASAA